ncbi:DUF945 family protein [Marinobacteraceae bacterium S3BR75-40.1]
MRKLALAGLVILIAIAAIGPWVTGHLVEREWGEAIERFNRQQDIVQLETVSYELGYMSGVTRTRVTFTAPDLKGRALLLETRFSHGVTDARGETHWLMEQWPDVAAAFGDEGPVLVTKSELWGDIYGKFTVPAAQWKDAQGGEVRLEPLRIDYSFAKAGDHAELELKWQGGSISADTGSLKLAGLTLKEDIRRLEKRVWTGHIDFGIESVEGSAPDSPAFALSDIRMASQSEQTGEDRIRSQTDLSVARLAMGDRSFQNLELQAVGERLYVPALSQLLKRMQAYEDLARIEDPNERAVQELKAFGQVMEAAQSLAGHGVELSLPKLLIDTPEGKIRGRLGLTHPELSDEEIENLGSLLLRSQGALSLVMPKAFVEQADPQLRQAVTDLLARGWMTVQGDNLVLEAELKAMALHIGGEAIPLPPLI